ncbi:hypothetical protein, conserved [Leishmania tarentolae]|uniref:tRNA-uridine aminocarboxypropyltransferase n=1 Tax=Leishmania tarentolae TaxID=5689 RepID=A0A640KMD3_LEITA|nr:hypothetical protein, conserved [Leishmania tarentolae]
MESAPKGSSAVQQIDESLISSCRAASNPYKRSMLRLLKCVGLQHYGTPYATMPPRTSEESARIAQHMDEVREAVARHQESVRCRNIRINKRKLNGKLVCATQCTVAASGAVESDGERTTMSDDSVAGSNVKAAALPTIYLSCEESLEWKAFLASVDPKDRHSVTVLRRLSVALWYAHQRDLCLWCWFPRGVCICAELDAYRAMLPADVLDQHVEVTMLLHSEELMRGTNSGHIAAYLLGAPLRVWGLDEDDTYLKQLPAVEHRRKACSVERPAVVYHVSLYPSSDAVSIEHYIHNAHLYHAEMYGGCSQERGRDERRTAKGEADIDSGDPGASSNRTHAMSLEPALSTEHHAEGAVAHPVPPLTFAGCDSHSPCKLHLILLDSTWGQALSLNRHITRLIPRVSLEIPDDYKSLFEALRKRTRGTCVSTLEATSMAISQCVGAVGYAAEAASTLQTLLDAMKQFVDAQCLLKHANAQFSTNSEALEEFCNRRDDACRRDAARRQEVCATQMQEDESAKLLRLPPVLNYCYTCDCMVGWHRMIEHVMGRSHQTTLEGNPSSTPSALSRKVVVPDFARPRRLKEKRVNATAPQFNGAEAAREHLPH